MSSKLHRGGGVPAEPVAWRRVSPLDVVPEGDQYIAAAFSSADVPAKDINAQRREAGPSAHQKGFQEGQAAARRETAAQLESMNLKLARTIGEFSGLRQRFRHEAEEDVVALSIAIARRILHRELTMAPEALLGLVKAALEKIDVREVHRVCVAREDAAMVRQFLEKIGLPRPVEVIGDPGLSRGAAVLDSNRGTLDASVETQLAEIERGFADLVRRT